MTDELMNGSDTEFIGLRDIELTDNPDNSRVLTPEANVHVIDEWNTHSKGLEANKKMKIRKEKKMLQSWKWNVSPHYRENCLHKGGVSYQFDESALAIDIYEQVINLDVLMALLVQQTNLYLQQNGRNFITNAKEMKAFIGVNYIMAVN